MSAPGFIDYAVNLVGFDHKYDKIFSYVFGSTVVFRDLQQARAFMGKQRIVTLAGELLEASGAMTGGNINQKATLQFGTGESSESAEIANLRQRLQAIENILQLGRESIEKDSINLRQASAQLAEIRQQQRISQIEFDRLTQEIAQLTHQKDHLQGQQHHAQQELTQTTSSLQSVSQGSPQQEQELADLRQELAELEASGIHGEWQTIQSAIRQQEIDLQQKERELATAQGKLTEIEQKNILGREKIAELERRYLEYQTQADQQKIQTAKLQQDLGSIEQEITSTQATLAQLEQHLGAEKSKRDLAEQAQRQLQTRQQERQWELQKSQEQQAQLRQSLVDIVTAIQTQRTELPPETELVPAQEPIDPETLFNLQNQIKSLKRRMEAMEPVNMLALQAYEEANARLEELNQKLATLAAETNELLLRIENFTTLRLQAFKEAFDAVNVNFQNIFAELSDGDGFLQLDDPQDPFNGGLNLVAHPKGKPVQRLTSMSGGEKSLTALSFIFALQRYRPSPFYAFDEVDMFLDGANVERLAKMIRKQADQAQFIVVSLRRPMIEAADRTIGVTQARGAYTQVLGIDLKSPV
jgi:chromosome segregation protein